ncbi:hypothetical protein PM082_014783 [Marasmius tenuissimus]|nr:hypothetical protein PM082_014783 [Marasmius tenuissimus]
MYRHIGAICGLTSLLSLFFLFPQHGAGFQIDSTATLPTAITVSQTITVGWSRESSTDVFNIELIYLNSQSNPIGTQPVQVDFSVTPGTNNIQRGTVTFVAQATGRLEFVAVNTILSSGITTTTPDTMLATEVAVMPPASATSAGSSTVSSVFTTDGFATSTAISTELRASVEAEPSSFQAQPSGSKPTSILNEPVTPQSTEASSSALMFLPTTANNKKQKSIIIGSVTGSVTLLLLVLLGALFVVRRQKKRKQSHNGFQRDMMVVKRADTNASTRSPSREKVSADTVNPISSNPPLQDKYHGSSENISLCTQTSAETRTLDTSSTSGTSAASSEWAMNISGLPLSADSQLPRDYQQRPRARTDRQMQIEQKVIELQGRFVAAGGSEQEESGLKAALKNQIETVKVLRESEWAYGGKGEVPDVLKD